MNDQKYSEEVKKISEAVKKINEACEQAAATIGEALVLYAKAIEPTIQKMKTATQKIYEIQKASLEPDPSRRRFEAVATKRRGKCKRNF